MNTFTKFAVAGAGATAAITGAIAFETATNTEIPVFAWAYDARVNAECNNLGQVILSGSFLNSEQANPVDGVDANAMNVDLRLAGSSVARFNDANGSPIIDSQESGSAKYNTGLNSIGSTNAGIKMSWAFPALNPSGPDTIDNLAKIGPITCEKPLVSTTTTTEASTTTTTTTPITIETTTTTTSVASTTTGVSTTIVTPTTNMPERKTTSEATEICDVRFESGRYIVYIVNKSTTFDADGDEIGQASSIRIATGTEEANCLKSE